MYKALFICSLAVVSSQRYPKSIQALSGYSSNVLHHNSYDENSQPAQSSINVNFNSQRQNPNLFNVGYNLRFNEHPPAKVDAHKYTHVVSGNKKYKNAEVITGRLKKNEQVRAPGGADLSPRDYVSHAFLKQKKSSVKHTSVVPQRQPNYNTQQTIFRDVIKAARPEWSQNMQEGDLEGFATFNHEVALKSSQPFDFSHAHGDIKVEEDNAPAASDQQQYIITENPQASDLNNINIAAHIPKKLRGVKPLPLDTSLLKEPVLTTNNYKGAANDRVIPIHFDVRPIQNVMQQEIGKGYYQNSGNFGQQPQHFGYSSPPQTYQKNSQRDQSGGGNYGGGSQVDYDYGKEEDIYKIVSMRPPPPPSNSPSGRY